MNLNEFFYFVFENLDFWNMEKVKMKNIDKIFFKKKNIKYIFNLYGCIV